MYLQTKHGLEREIHLGVGTFSIRGLTGNSNEILLKSTGL